jgi:hypothetical protein
MKSLVLVFRGLFKKLQLSCTYKFGTFSKLCHKMSLNFPPNFAVTLLDLEVGRMSSFLLLKSHLVFVSSSKPLHRAVLLASKLACLSALFFSFFFYCSCSLSSQSRLTSLEQLIALLALV